MPSESKVYSISDNDFCQLIQASHSYSDCLRALGLKTAGSHSTDVLKKRIKALGCDISHFHRSYTRIMQKINIEDILIENSTYASTTSLKERIIKENILPYKCDICGISSWLNQPIALQLHHKNGNRTDNRIENLQLLCPNCHSQTDTYAGKSNGKTIPYTEKQTTYCTICGEPTSYGERCRKCANLAQQKVARPSRKMLKQMIRSQSMLSIAKIYNVSDNTIRKWCKTYGLPYRYHDIVNISDIAWDNI